MASRRKARHLSRKALLKRYSTTGSFDLGAQEFRFIAIRPDERAKQTVVIDPLVESAEWREEGGVDGNAIPILRGSVTLRKPHPDEPQINLHHGHRFRCDVRWGDAWKEVWTMRAYKPVLQVGDGSWQFELADDLLLLSRSEENFRYRKGKKTHRRGWRGDQIIADIARRFGVRCDCVRMRLYHKNFDEQGISPLEAIRKVVAAETEHTGQRLNIVWRNSRVTIVKPRRNPTIYKLQDQITAAQIEVNHSAQMATAYRARGSQKKGKKGKRRKKFKRLVAHREMVRKYGYVQRPVTIKGSIDSRRELIDKAKRKLAKSAKPVKKIEVSHYGIAFIRRMDAVQVEIPQEGYTGSKGVLWVQSVAHSLSSGTYTMDLTFRYEDPYDPVKIQKERDAAARKRKRETRKKKAKT